MMVIMLSAKGGWAGIDQGVRHTLAAHSRPVVGYDWLRYYGSSCRPKRQRAVRVPGHAV
ncbi:AcvB/VirJ family lysyl-phosphatidylglycerol hydrolase [Salinisphaera sp. SWV1]|uniref:AcvB/VirJ family lysyl-phosphatidylglycerol hydrolase n=2 Tax=unclassified Salinisphaera TaxID=2649847 RepID=UPI003F856699